ncbi:MAG: hypothetical protein J5517_04315 [Eubacterium sp.]|nr:hypothetical protein [Eubacterium sp.]
MNREKKTLIVIYAVSVAVFLTIFFAIPFDKIATSWVAFSFAILSLVIGLCVSLYAIKDGKNLKSKVYGFPMFRLGNYYTIAQIIVSIVFIVIASFAEVPTWISIVTGVILLGIIIVGIVAVDNSREYIIQQESNDKIKTYAIEDLRIIIESLINKSSDKKSIEKLAEDFKYSDPISNEKTYEIESLIASKVLDLEKVINENGDSSSLINEISQLLKRRNIICKETK